MTDNPLTPRFWALPPDERDQVFARMRADPEPCYLPYAPNPGWPAQGGYWAVTRYAEIEKAGRTPKVFRSAPTTCSLDDSPKQLASLLDLDDPHHGRLRRAMTPAFSPRALARLDHDIHKVVEQVVDDLVERGPCDFVTEVATRIPSEITRRILGVSEHDWADTVATVRLSIDAFYSTDPVSIPTLTAKMAAFQELLRDLIQHRRRHPADDLITMVAHDEDLNAEEDIRALFLSLVNAGYDTTRHTISSALTLLTDHPGQKELLFTDPERWLSPAIEEILRFWSPVPWIRRNVAEPVTLGTHTYRPGDRVILYYLSGNRDESIFDDPHRFDITRPPKPHLSFGGGPHYCLGATLARRELVSTLRTLYTRLPDIHATAPPARTQIGIINGIKHLPCAFTP